MDEYIKIRPKPPRASHLNRKVEQSQLMDLIELWSGHAPSERGIEWRAMTGAFLPSCLTAFAVQLLEAEETVAGIAQYQAGPKNVALLPRQFKHADFGADDVLILSHGELVGVRRCAPPRRTTSSTPTRNGSRHQPMSDLAQAITD